MSVSIPVSQTLTGVATLCFDVGASQNRIHVSLPSTSAEGGAYEKEVLFGNTYQRDNDLVMDGDTAASSQRFKVQGTYPLTDSKGVTDSLGTLLFEMLQQYGLSDAQRIENVSNDPQDVRLANLRGLRLMSLHPSVKGY